MPIYEYVCMSCECHFEELVGMSDPDPHCPDCGNAKVASQAYGAGAKILKPVKDEFYGDRNGSFEDPFGHIWFIATRKENVTPEEIQKRSAQLFG